MTQPIKNISILDTASFLEALKKLDKTAEKVLLVINTQNKFLGTLTDGDIRRHLLKGRDLEKSIKSSYNQKSIYLDTKDFSKAQAKRIMLEKKIQVLPFIDSNKIITGYLTWAEAFSEETPLKQYKKGLKKVSVVIMAGGKGTRMDPFTRVLPKPLVPIGDQTIMEKIMESFAQFGVKDHYVTLNYKGSLIKAYFENAQTPYSLNWIWEKDFYGTAGSLKLLPSKISDDFIVTNCDILVKADYNDVYNFHRKNDALLTIVASIKHSKIPYGVVQFGDGGNVNKILEKPENTYTINTGIYLLNKKALDYIPSESYYDMPELINTLIKNKETVLAYPVNESDYIDIGQWKEYREGIERIKPSCDF